MLPAYPGPNWIGPAVLAAGTWLIGTKLVPALFGKNILLHVLAMAIVPVAWVLTFVFALIAIVTYFQSRIRQDSVPVPLRPVKPPVWNAGTPPAPGPIVLEPSEVDREWTRWGPSNPSPAPQRPTAWSLDVLDRVEWKHFEDLCCRFYQEKGIRAETTRLGADGGIDVRLFQDDTTPARITSIVQCKAWNQQVGVKSVRELRGVMAHEKVEKAFFMAPNGFTNEAKAFATDNRIVLIDGHLFLAMLQRLPLESSQRLLVFATEGDWTTPTCPSCGIKMKARQGKRGGFWGCASYPKCRGKLPMRGAAIP